jgi:prepilin-type N-terminal cleavage/methylation domain-containing protein
MRKDAGFTLLEILVAIALASILMTSIYGVFSTTSGAKEQVEKQGEALHLGRVLIERLDRELLGLNLNDIASTPALSGGKNSLGESFLELLTTSARMQTASRPCGEPKRASIPRARPMKKIWLRGLSS